MLMFFFVSFQAILAAVVIANLIGLLRQFSRLRDLWKIHKPDAVRYSYFFYILLIISIFQRIDFRFVLHASTQF